MYLAGEISNGKLGASHKCKDSVAFPLVLLYAPVSTVDLVTVSYRQINTYRSPLHNIQ